MFILTWTFRITAFLFLDFHLSKSLIAINLNGTCIVTLVRFIWPFTYPWSFKAEGFIEILSQWASLVTICPFSPRCPPRMAFKYAKLWESIKLFLKLLRIDWCLFISNTLFFTYGGNQSRRTNLFWSQSVVESYRVDTASNCRPP